MLSPLSDVLANITLAHCDAVGRGHPLHQLSVQINTSCAPGGMRYACQTDAEFIPHPLCALKALHSGRWLTYVASQTWFKILAASAALSCGKNRP